jgi:hypothetical protein
VLHEAAIGWTRNELEDSPKSAWRDVVSWLCWRSSPTVDPAFVGCETVWEHEGWMRQAKQGNLGGRLWTIGARACDVEPLLRSFLARYAVTLERVVLEDGNLNCVVQGPLSALESLSVGVVIEKLREWLPPTRKIRVTELQCAP